MVKARTRVTKTVKFDLNLVPIFLCYSVVVDVVGGDVVVDVVGGDDSNEVTSK